MPMPEEGLEPPTRGDYDFRVSGYESLRVFGGIPLYQAVSRDSTGSMLAAVSGRFLDLTLTRP